MSEYGAEVLVTSTLLGRDCVPGDLLSQEEVERISENVRGSLVRTGTIRLLDGEPPDRDSTPEELEVERARGDVADAAITLAEIREEKEAAKAEVERAVASRRKHALKATSGDDDARAALDQAREDQRAAEMRLEDIEEAERQAAAEVEEAERAERRAELARRRAEAERLSEERVETAGRIDHLITKAAAEVDLYLNQGHRIDAVLGPETSSQITSRWRLDARLNHMLGLAFVDPEHRKPLAEIERHVLEEVLRRAMRRLEENEDE